MKSVTVTLEELAERTRELSGQGALAMADPWTALEYAAAETHDKIDALETELGDILHSVEWDAYDDKPDWDAVLRRVRGED
jgi:hypothetical protein